MQLLPPLTKDAAAAVREQPSGKHLPYARHVDDHTIETRDGLLMQIIQVRGLLFETADTMPATSTGLYQPGGLSFAQATAPRKNTLMIEIR
ncbi:hypothetical protein [Sphingomonas segetis]|jgi:hypothetical protein|uniref:hypothetical protein n=1 Tax=Sphingomonas segetis TaxID=1104779 RepID=UPI0012D35896|nr:hypothetical protein [Sphingomonas segetis]